MHLEQFNTTTRFDNDGSAAPKGGAIDAHGKHAEKPGMKCQVYW